MANEPQDNPVGRLTAPLVELFGLSRSVAVTVIFFAGILIAAAVYWFVHSAPPSTITITSGPPGSSFELNAKKYAAFLARKHLTLRVLPSAGSLENLKLLNDPKSAPDIGFVQGGVTNDPSTNKLMSLGSVTYAPLLVFYRSATPISFLSGFAGKRLAIGPLGSGTRSLALQLLAYNGIKTNGSTVLAELDGNAAAQALIDQQMDAIFLMSDSASQQVITNLLHSTGVQLFDFTQADAYTRRITYINKLVMPEGLLDFAHNVPSHDLNLVGPTVEVIAKPGLHPAISDILIEAMQDTHMTAGVFKRQGEFPAPLQHDFPISADASRYYTSGKTFFYRTLPFWLASRVNRILVAFVPLIVVLIPSLRLIPAALKWRMQLRLNRWYRALLTLERSLSGKSAQRERNDLMSQLLAIETEVNKMKVPASFADQFYNLRGHIIFVRQRIAQLSEAA